MIKDVTVGQKILININIGIVFCDNCDHLEV